MIKSTRNQMGNAGNVYQNNDKRVLCVCSAGLLRSPTLAQYLQQTYGYNTRACGTAEEYALIPISEALVQWADLVVFVSPENFHAVKEEPCLKHRPCIVLDLPDQFERNQPELLAAIKEQWDQWEDDV